VARICFEWGYPAYSLGLKSVRQRIRRMLWSDVWQPLLLCSLTSYYLCIGLLCFKLLLHCLLLRRSTGRLGYNYNYGYADIATALPGMFVCMTTRPNVGVNFSGTLWM